MQCARRLQNAPRATVPRPSRLQAGSWSWRHYHHRTLTYRPMAIWKREKWNKRRRGEIVQRGAAMFASHLAAIMRVPTPVPYCYWFPFHHFTNYTFPSACNHSCLLHYDDEQFMAILPVKYTSHPAVFLYSCRYRFALLVTRRVLMLCGFQMSVIIVFTRPVDVFEQL